MKVLIYGECADACSGAWCYYQAFRDFGADVAYYDRYSYVTPFYNSLFFKVLKRLNNRLPWKAYVDKHNLGFIQLAKSFKPEIIIVLKGLLLQPQTIQMLKDSGAWVININHDDFFTSNPNNMTQMLKDSIPFYSHIFTTREVNVKEMEALNPHVSFFPFAFYPPIHRKPDYNKEDYIKWHSDVVFVGTWDKLREETLAKVAKAVPVNYAIYGGQWEKMSTPGLKTYVKKRLLKGDEMAKAFFYSKVCIGFLSKENRDDYTQRTFEIPACGGVLLAERTKRHLQFYNENKEAVFFDYTNVEELISKIKLLLEDIAYRENIRNSGYSKVLNSGNTYADRINQLVLMYNKRDEH